MDLREIIATIRNSGSLTDLSHTRCSLEIRLEFYREDALLQGRLNAAVGLRCLLKPPRRRFRRRPHRSRVGYPWGYILDVHFFSIQCVIVAHFDQPISKCS